jgi:outer membrane protein assembly factor BamB
MLHWLAILTASIVPARRASADWPQLRHDGAHTGKTEETVRPPLKLRWTVTDDPEASATASPLPVDEQFLHRPLKTAPVDIVSPLATPELFAAEGLVFASRAGSGIVCLEAKSGAVVWHDPLQAYLAAVEKGLLVAYKADPDQLSLGEPLVVRDALTGVPLWTLDTWRNRTINNLGVHDGAGQERWAFTSRSAGFIPLIQSLGGVRGGLICVCVSEWHARDRWVPMEGFPGQTVFEVEDPHSASFCFLDTAGGYLISENECLPEGVRRKGHGCSPYDYIYTRAWGEELMLIGCCGLDHDRRHRNAPPLWAMTVDGEALPGPAISNYGVRQAMLKGTVLAEDAGLAFLYAQSDTRGMLACHHAISGELLWTVPLTSTTNVNFPPAVSESAMYIGLANGIVHALELSTGAVRWSTEVGEPLRDLALRSAHALEPICSLSGEVLWVVYRGSLLALDAKTGDIEWQTDETEAAWYEPVISDGWIYLSTIHGIEAWGPDHGTAGPEEHETTRPQDRGTAGPED